jgi:uncharacterized membrane protein HdeD (DUF308 family)
MADELVMPRPLLGKLSIYWGWLLALGIIQVILGIVGLSMTAALTIATVFVYGVFLLIAGSAQIAHSFTARGWRSILLHLAIAVLYVLTGIIIVTNPLVATFAATLALGFLFTVTGVVRFIMAMQMRGSRSWGWYLLSAVISIILGIMIVIQWPLSALWVIGLFVAIELLFNGWALIMVALVAREQHKLEIASEPR